MTAAAAVLILGLAACSGSTAGNGADSTADSAPAADSLTADSASVQEPEAAEAQLLVTPDLTLLEVKGNVKSIKGKVSAKFDEQGTLTHYGYSNPLDKISNVKRDSEGRLTYFLGSEWMTVKWDGGRLASLESRYNEFVNTDIYTYDEAGHIVKIVSKYVDENEETSETFTYVVTYPADGFDEKGNWVKRTVKYPDSTEAEVRTITYY